MLKINFSKAIIIAILFPALLFGQAAPTLEKVDAITFGPQLGNVTSNSIRVWARTKQPSSFSVIYSTKEDLSLALTSKTVQTAWVNDISGWVELTGLRSNTKYYYALVIDGKVVDTKVNGNINSFLTLPNKADYVDAQLNPKGLFNFSFEVGTGNSQNHGKTKLPATYTTMLNNLKDKIYFQIQNGDWLYEDNRDFTKEQWVQANNVKNVPAITDLAVGLTGVWENYKTYLGRSKPLSNFYREIPLFVTLDDHEILNDVIGSGQKGFRFDARGKGFQENSGKWTADENVKSAVFRDPALKAWDDYVGWSNPNIGLHNGSHFGIAKLKKGSDILIDNKTDFTKLNLKNSTNLHVLWGYGNTGVYEIVEVLGTNKVRISPAAEITEDAKYSIGTNRNSNFTVGNTDFFLLDTRSNRTLHDKRNPKDSTTSMLGQKEEDWLFEGLKNSKADIIFVVSSVNFAVPHDNGAWYGQGSATAGKDDGWTAQLPERERLIKLVEKLGKPVFILSGDLHKSFVARITPGFYDIGSGPHTSGNHRLVDAGGSPASGYYQSGDRLVNILWTSNQYRNDSKRYTDFKGWPIYTVIKVNNAYNIPNADGSDRWIAYPEPQVIIEFHDGNTGELSFAYSVSTSDAKATKTAVPLEQVKVAGGIEVKK